MCFFLQATSLTTLLVFLTANWIFIFDRIVEMHPGKNWGKYVLGFDEIDGIVTVMISLIFSVLFFSSS